MNKVLGLDIGISSVGWGIIDQDTGEIIDAGVRLFEEATRNANEDRRGFRGSRRLIRRRAHRLERGKKLLEDIKFPVKGFHKINPYKARYNAIFSEVTREELTVALLHLVKRRGTTITSPEEEESKSDNELSTKEQISRNSKLLKNQYICEIQLKRLENKNEKIRNHENRFRTEDYVKEARAILEKQRNFYPELSDEFIGKYILLIEQRRAYYDGPGSEISLTPYGRFSLNKKGEVIETSMINQMRGTCSYFKGEPRIAKMSFTADLYNLLSGDLNKLMLDGEYLSYEDKLNLVNTYIRKGENLTLKRILAFKGLSDDVDIKGCRIDMKSNKPAFTEFKGYKEIYKIVLTHNLPSEILDDGFVLDSIADILTAEKSYERRGKEFRKLFQHYENEQVDQILNAFKESTVFKGYHSLSKKAIELILEDLWFSNKNHIQLFHERGLDEKRLIREQKSSISFDDDAILSTVAKRAHRETVKIVNALRKKYGEFSSIIVETAREKNSDEKRKKYSDFQASIGKHDKEMAKLLGVKSLAELKLSSKQHLALRLWVAQDHRCIYSGQFISIHDIVENSSNFEIDHIIPISISFDDSQANKVLCLHGENQKKGQNTPFQYFHSGKANRLYAEYKDVVLKLYASKKITNKKKEYLLEQRDIKNNKELQKEFINRNLIDTQYAMRSFSMTLRTFFKIQEIDTKIFSIRGSFTSALRKRARMNKNRDDGHAHHAIDALIVASIKKLPVFEFFNEFNMSEEGVIFNRETGEILEEDQFFENQFLTFIRSLMNYESKLKYSHKVDRKANRSISKQTIYGTRERDGEKYYLGKSKNIYNLNKDDTNKLIKKIKDKPDSFLMSKHNPDTFQLVNQVIDNYKNAINPFADYFKDHGYILKDGKVPVKRLRYYDSKLGVHMNITNKYPNAKNDVVLLSIKSVRVDIYMNGEGKYKYLGVPIHWFKERGDKYVLDMNLYEKEKAQSYKKIDSTFEYQLSLYKNDLFSFEKNDELQYRIFRGDNNPRQNKIEVDFVHKKKSERKEGMMAPSTFKKIIKYNVDILGNTYKIEKEIFKNYLHL